MPSVLSDRAAQAVRQLAYSDPGGPAAGGFVPPGPVAWVRVTGGASPWWAGVIEVRDLDAGTWQTFAACEVEVSGGTRPLAVGDRPLCVRTGDKADGTPRFTAQAPGGGPFTIYRYACVDGNLIETPYTVTP